MEEWKAFPQRYLMNANLITASSIEQLPLPEGSLSLQRLSKLRSTFLKIKMKGPRSSEIILVN
jgi:hypothetical protein